MGDPHRVFLIVGQVPDPAASADLDLPLLRVAASERTGGQTTPQPVERVVTAPPTSAG